MLMKEGSFLWTNNHQFQIPIYIILNYDTSQKFSTPLFEKKVGSWNVNPPLGPCRR